MPGDMNGLQLVEAARRQRPGLQALLASGYSREALQNLAQLRDDVAFLQKPYNISQLSNQFGIASIGTVAK
jgi:DNA-binding NtrC family response regulator